MVAIGFGVTAAGVLGHIGRRTLPISVLHMPALAICHAVLLGPMSSADPPMQLLLTVMVTRCCLALERSLPAALVDLPGRGARAAPRQRRAGGA